MEIINKLFETANALNLLSIAGVGAINCFFGVWSLYTSTGRELLTASLSNRISHTKFWSNQGALTALSALVIESVSKNDVPPSLWALILGVSACPALISKFITLKYGQSCAGT